MTELNGVETTALVMAVGRAIESARPDRLFDDPWARDFVDAAGLAMPDPARTAAGRGAAGAAWVVIRTRFIDDYLLSAARSGVPQIVILGAGLDTRALRLPWPAGTVIYELDDDPVLAFKQSVLDSSSRSSRSAARRVPVVADVTGPYPTQLQAAGFDCSHRTAWLLEGLLLYLTGDAGDGVLASLSSLSSQGSRLALTLTPPGQKRRDSQRAEKGLGYHNPYWVSDGPSDPVTWLADHEWDAELTHPATCARRYGRAPAPSEDVSDPPRRLLVTAARHE